MALTIARQGVASLSSSCSTSLRRSSSSSFGIGAPSTSASTTATTRTIGSFFFSPRMQLSLTAAPQGVSRVQGSGEASNSGCFNDAIALLGKAPVLPKLVVLDLDFTVWPFYCWLFQSWELLPDLSFSTDLQLDDLGLFTIECPFPSPSDAVDDIDKILLSAHQWASGKYWNLDTSPAVFPHVVDIIKALAAHEVEMAIASRTPSASVAKSFLDKLSISQYFSSMEIYFTIYSKGMHFASLKEKTGIPFSSMLFFDNETKNIKTAERLGVSSVLVTEGLDLKSLEKGLNVLASRNW